MIGGYAIGWLADRIGRRKALILSSVLAEVFTWPFGYVTNYPALVVPSLVDTLGFAGYLAINVVCMGEVMGSAVRSKVIKVAEVLAIVPGTGDTPVSIQASPAALQPLPG